ncbi:MAG: hypothetical protein WKF83_00720 [Nocardioidaceae bacterium]
MMLYDIPGRTGVRIARETLRRARRATRASSRSRTPIGDLDRRLPG